MLYVMELFGELAGVVVPMPMFPPGAFVAVVGCPISDDANSCRGFANMMTPDIKTNANKITAAIANVSAKSDRRFPRSCGAAAGA